MPHRPHSWRFPIAIGITFWIWANVDGWFFVGPMALALVLAGELVQRRLGSMVDPDSTPRTARLPAGRANAGEGARHWPRGVHVEPASRPGLGTSVRARRADGAVQDPRIKQVLLSPSDGDYSSSTSRGRVQGGYNLNGLAYVVLFVGGGLALGLGAATPVRAPCLVGRLRPAQSGLDLRDPVIRGRRSTDHRVAVERDVPARRPQVVGRPPFATSSC